MNAIKVSIESYGKYVLVAIACLFIILGIFRKEHFVVLKKATNICLECIGLG